jgi:ATP-dependent DNA helicase RecG
VAANDPPGVEPGDAPLTSLRGVGSALAAKLAGIGLGRVRDLWFHLPLRYEDLTRVVSISELVPGAPAQVEGVVEAVERGFRFRPQLRVALGDGSRATLMLRFFHFNRAQADRFAPGTRWRVHGEVRVGAHGLEMVHPICKPVEPGAPLESELTSVYPTTDGVHSRRIAALVHQALARLPEDAELECVPLAWRRKLALGSMREALRIVHRPPPHADVAALMARRHPAQARLAFDELLAHRLSLRCLRRDVQSRPGPSVGAPGARRGRLLAALGFDLTGAQQRVLAEVEADLARGRPMLRLVQGDVGSGKTAVAALAALAAVDAGWQAAVLAPTEVLASQHRQNFERWLTPLGVRVVWLAGSQTAKQRRLALEDVAGAADIVVGTHAVIQDTVHFRRLGLAIVDEQHRFGVHQRLKLRDKGDGDVTPHQLVMTATPIPRTLAMTAYADLDVSVIDEMPPGRTPVTTVVMNASRREEVIERIRTYCATGRQAYWVCTLIEESEQLEAQAAEAAHAALVVALPELGIGFVHGRMRPADKARVMGDFKDGQLAVLVATTVIEVGVDVPNASLMVIENAERLGLSQLHQLRGRVGRGTEASTCLLLYQPPLSQAARERLDVMRETNDGFRIAEKDLELRGPGEVLGTRQTGIAGFRVADLARDAAMLPSVAETAETLLAIDSAAADRLIVRWIGQGVRYADA